MGDSAALEQENTMADSAVSLEGADGSQNEQDLNDTMAQLDGLGSPAAGTGGRAGGQAGAGGDANDLIWDIPVDVNIVLGTTQLSVARLMELEPGEVVELNRRIGEPLDITVNGRKVAKGEIVMREDDPTKFAVQVVEIVGR